MNFFKRKQPKAPRQPARQPLPDPIGALATSLLDVMNARPGEMWIVLDDGHPDGTHFVQLIMVFDELMGEIGVEAVDEMQHPTLQARGWMDADPNWRQFWPAGTSPHTIAQVCIETMRAVHGADSSFFIEINYA